jgi:hypothetical protein
MKELEREIDQSTKLAEDFNILVSIMDRTVGQKINKEMQELNNTVD